MSNMRSLAELKLLANVSPAIIPQSHAGSGVCGHSTTEFWAEYVVVSVGNTPIIDAAFKTFCLVWGIPYKSLMGSYKGQTETSFILPAASLPTIARHAWLNEQESILHLSMPRNKGGGQFERDATLIFMADGHAESIGRFKQTGREKAMAQDAWTFCPLTGTYWICE